MKSLLSSRHSGRRPVLLLAVALFIAAPAARASVPGGPRSSPTSVPGLPAYGRSEGDVVPVRELARGRTGLRGVASSSTAGDTIWVYSQNNETLVSPSNEGGWTHEDGSAQPTAWHIDTLYSCQGHGFWMGRVDSSWTNDPNRYGYDNSWTQYLGNYVDLTGAASPVTLGFKYQMDIEPDYDYGTVEVLDPDESWIPLGTFTGVHHGTGSAACDTFSVVIPDSIIAKYNPIQFRFVFKSDIQGSSADGLYAGDGWSVDNVTVMAGFGDVRFFDDFEIGPGTWSVSVFPPVGDYWRVDSNVPSEQICTSNASRVWIPTSPITGALVPRQDDRLVSPAVAVNRSDRVFFAFDTYRNLPLLSCFYYNLRYRTKNAGDAAWSGWLDPTGLIYFGTEREWVRQTVALPGAGGKDSVQVRIGVKDYSQIYCDGVSTPGGTMVLFDNLSLGVIGLAGPTLQASEADLFNDTFRTTAFYVDDNFNTARGDSASVRVGASRGLKSATMFYRLNGGSFSSVPLTPTGPLAPTAFYADVPAGAYPRGTVLDYYFTATDSLNDSVALPADALTNGRYFQATVLPAVQAASARCAGDSANVLYVNAAYGLAAPTPIDSALAAVGLRYDRYDVNAPQLASGNSPGGAVPGQTSERWPGVTAADLDRYTAIVWDVGDRSSGLLSSTDQLLLQGWLALTGRNRGLLLSGDNIAYDLVINARDVGTFLTCTLGATYLRDIWETSPQDSLTPLLAGAPNTYTAGDAYRADGSCPSVNRFDAVTTSTCAGSAARMWVRYPANLMAAVENRAPLGVAGDSAKSVLLAVNLGSLAGPIPRNVLLWRTLVQEFEVPYCYVPTGVETASPPAPAARPALLGASPNPFNPATTIRFRLVRAARARVLVFDVNGALVRTLADRVFDAGAHALPWDGRDGRGRELASGAYICRLEADGAREAKKLILLR